MSIIHQPHAYLARIGTFVSAIALISLVACAKKSGVVPTPTATPAPTPSAITSSAASLTLSLTGAGGVPSSIPNITLTQTNATGALTVATTTCYGATPSPTSILMIPTNLSTSFINGTATLTFGSITSQAVGACSFVVTPASGTPLTIPITVAP